MSYFRVKPLAAAIATTLAFTAATQAQESPRQSAVLEEVLVEGVRAAEQNAREMERMKDVFSSVISQDDAGNFADQNVAEALQRLPGITLQKNDGQGEFVNLRGMGPNFVGVSMNNSEMATTSGDGRAVGLNTIPADLMGSIEVFKSLTPDMELNSIAGRVNVNSVTAFDRGDDTLRLTLQGAVHEQRGEWSPKLTVVGTKLFADDTLGVALSLSHEERGTEVNQIHNSGGDLRYVRVSRPGIGDDYEAMSAAEYQSNYFRGEDGAGADPYYDQTRMLTPYEFEVRQDESVRTTTAATLDLGWRPTANSEYFARLARTDFTDEELTLREYYRFGSGDARYVSYVDPEANFFAVSDADLQHRIFFEEANDVTTTYALGGENLFADTWTLDYKWHHSESERVNPDDRRAQFRTRSLPMYGQAYQDDIIAQILARTQIRQLAESVEPPTQVPNSGVPGTGGYVAGFSEGVQGYVLGQRRQPNMQFDNVYLEDGSRTDELDVMELNLRKDFDTSWLNYVKAGVQVKERARANNRSRWDVNPATYIFACEEDPECLSMAKARIGSAGLETYTPRNPRFDHDFVTVADAERMIAATRMIPMNLDPESTGFRSKSDNYEVFENSNAAYLMGEFQIGDNASVIAGARYVETEYGSTGWLTLRHDRFLNTDGVTRDITMPLSDPESGSHVVNEYDGVYPGVHLRYEPTDNLLVRTALWTSFTRPDFDEANAGAEFDNRVVLCREEAAADRPRCSDHLEDDLHAPNTGYVEFTAENLTLAEGADPGNPLELGNTDLKSMEAVNFDASISWYGDNGHFFEIAAFYKDLSDYIVDVRGIDIARADLPTPVALAIDQIDSTTGGGEPGITQNVFRIAQDHVFTDVSTTINGESATVYGIETSYSRYFQNGLFVSGNMTLLDSKADAGETVRAEDTALPNQADITTNLTLGWENEDISARLIGNYRSEVLKQIGSCSQADIDQDAEWARLNDASNPDALDGAVGSGTIYPEACRSWADVFHGETFSLDFKATYNWGDNVKFYFDALNLTEDEDVFYYRGNEYSNGEVLYESEGLGRSYQVGVNYRIW